MNKSVEQALTGLVPSLSGPSPPELLNLALSLLAQSRSNASSLKPEEEIARTYVCAHLACARLKQPLNLPQLVPRPPCPPRIYKKLYAYFDTALSSRPSRTPTRQRTAAKDGPTPTSTPRKAQTPAKGTTPTATPRKRTAPVRDDEDVPEWVMPTIRALCKALGAPAATPHVFAGVASVLKAQRSDSSTPRRPTSSTPATRKRTRNSSTRVQSHATDQSLTIDDTNLPALLAVLTFYVLARLSGKDTTPAQYIRQRDEAISTLRSFEAVSVKDVEEEDLRRSIELLMREAQKGWLEMEWYQNVVEGSGVSSQSSGDVDTDEVADELDLENGTPAERGKGSIVGGGKGMLQAGWGTMMHGSIDWLSEERTADYRRWKKGIMARIEQIEQERGVRMMDTAAE